MTDNQGLTLKEFSGLVNGSCRFCDTPLPKDVECYEHESGWKVIGKAKRQWVYVTCPKCSFQTSLAKLNIPRNFGVGE